MSLKRHFELMATYNRWMNAKVYDAASELDNETLHADTGEYGRDDHQVRQRNER
jgi:uncharacterized damage-inducible protein DinB